MSLFRNFGEFFRVVQSVWATLSARTIVIRRPPRGLLFIDFSEISSTYHIYVLHLFCVT